MSSPPSPTIVLSSTPSSISSASSVSPIVSVPSARTTGSSMPPLVSLKPITPPSRTPSTMVPSVSPMLEDTVKVVQSSSSVTPKPSIKPASPRLTTIKSFETPSQTTVIVPKSPASRVSFKERDVPMSITPPASMSSNRLSLTTVPSPVRSTQISPPRVSGQSSPRIVLGSSGTMVKPSSPVTIEPAVMQKSVEDILDEKGFTATDKVFIEKDGRTYAKYLKVTTDLGQTGFVELDSEGMVKYHPESRTMIEEDNAMMVPESKVIGAYECSMQSGGCGVAYDCTDEICVMSRPADSVDSITPVVLKKASRDSVSAVAVSGVPTAYPVVRLSEALENPMATKAAIERSTKAIRNAGVQDCKRKYDDTSKAANEMINALNMNYQVMNKYIMGLARDVEQLKTYRCSYLARAPLPDNEKAKAEEVVRLLHRRGEHIVESFKLCEMLPSITERVKELTAEINEMTKVINAGSISLGTTDQG